MQQARIVRYLAGLAMGLTAREIAMALELPFAVVREQLALLGPPPTGIGELIVLDGDRWTVAPPRPPAPEPDPEPTPCRIRLDGEHGAYTLDHAGQRVCGYCRQRVAAPVE